MVSAVSGENHLLFRPGFAKPIPVYPVTIPVSPLGLYERKSSSRHTPSPPPSLLPFFFLRRPLSALASRSASANARASQSGVHAAKRMAAGGGGGSFFSGLGTELCSMLVNQSCACFGRDAQSSGGPTAVRGVWPGAGGRGSGPSWRAGRRRGEASGVAPLSSAGSRWDGGGRARASRRPTSSSLLVLAERVAGVSGLGGAGARSVFQLHDKTSERVQFFLAHGLSEGPTERLQAAAEPKLAWRSTCPSIPGTT